MKHQFDEERAKEVLENGKKKAAETINDPERSREFFEKVEKKIRNSRLSDVFEAIPLLTSMVKSYLKKEYREIPLGSIIAIVSALLYWLSPVDIIPDCIPGVGYVDDAAVVVACLAFIKSDLDDYKEWLENKKASETEETEEATK